MTTDRLMTWPEAVKAMRQGHHVQRKSEQWRKVIRPADEDTGEPGIVECGTEPMMLRHAWTDDERAVMVFMGAGSKCLFVPESEDMEATDWIVVKEGA